MMFHLSHIQVVLGYPLVVLYKHFTHFFLLFVWRWIKHFNQFHWIKFGNAQTYLVLIEGESKTRRKWEGMADFFSLSLSFSHLIILYYYDDDFSNRLSKSHVPDKVKSHPKLWPFGSMKKIISQIMDLSLLTGWICMAEKDVL